MKTIVFTGGGTAGHVTPNLALIDELAAEFDCVYVGTDGIEKRLAENRGIRFEFVPAVKVRRDAVFKNLAVPFKLTKCVSAAKKVLRALKPDLVFSKGGYAALPSVLAAHKLGIPILCHESDASPGITTKLTAKRAVKTLCAFPPCADAIKNGVAVGTPLDRKIRSVVRKPNPIRPTVLIMGGSSGAAAINECAVKTLPHLIERFDVIHITGKNKSEPFNAPGYRRMEFCTDMPSLYSAIDVAVSRAGANSLFELTSVGIPTVAVPLEKASRGDQIINAKYFADRGALAVLRQSDMTPDSLYAAVFSAYDRRAEFAKAIAALPPVDGTNRICEIIRETVQTKRTK